MIENGGTYCCSCCWFCCFRRTSSGVISMWWVIRTNVHLPIHGPTNATHITSSCFRQPHKSLFHSIPANVHCGSGHNLRSTIADFKMASSWSDRSDVCGFHWVLTTALSLPFQSDPRVFSGKSINVTVKPSNPSGIASLVLISTELPSAELVRMTSGPCSNLTSCVNNKKHGYRLTRMV